MASLSEVRASNATITEADTPRVAVFTGGTSGIGKSTLTQFVATKQPVRAYVLGRNEVKHTSFLGQLRQSNPHAEILWLEGQLSLLSETRRLCDEILAREKTETTEGLDRTMVLDYWGRMLFIHLLLPLLRASASSAPTYQPRIIVILAAGLETANFPVDDVELKQPGNLSLATYGWRIASLMTMGMEPVARAPENAEVVFVHHHPGLVKTGVLRNGWKGGWIGPALVLLLDPLLRLVMTSAEVAGEKCLYLITNAQFGGKGVKAKVAGLTVGGKEKGDLFLANERLESVQETKVLKDLREMRAYEAVSDETQEILKPYL